MPDREDFARGYAERSGISVRDLGALYGRYPEPCDCGEDGCEGWRMGRQWEDAIVEDKLRAAGVEPLPIGFQRARFGPSTGCGGEDETTIIQKALDLA